MAGRPAAGRGRELACGYAPAQRARHEGALAYAWNYLSGRWPDAAAARKIVSVQLRKA